MIKDIILCLILIALLSFADGFRWKFASSLFQKLKRVDKSISTKAGVYQPVGSSEPSESAGKVGIDAEDHPELLEVLLKANMNFAAATSTSENSCS